MPLLSRKVLSLVILTNKTEVELFSEEVGIRCAGTIQAQSAMTRRPIIANYERYSKNNYR